MNEIMKRKDVQVGVAVIIIIILAFVFKANKKSEEKTVVGDTINTETSAVNDRVVLDSNGGFDLSNETYGIGENTVTLVDGKAETKTTSGTVKTALLEGSAFADVNGDGIKDAVVLLRSDTGKEILYYVSAVLSGGTKVVTNSVLLGDRIRIKEISIDKGIISISILERVLGESITVMPSRSVTHTYHIVNGALTVI